MLFDAAGTLIQLREPVGESYARVARAHGVRVAPAELETAFRAAFAAAPAMLFPGAPLAEIRRLERAWWSRVVADTFRAADPTAHFRDFDAFFGDLFREMGRPRAWRAVPGTRQLLAELRSLGWALAIVSNFDRRLPRILRGLEIAEWLDAVILCSDVGAAKPDAAIFQRALERLGMPPARAVVVGDDDELDIRAARAAGLRAIDVKSLAKLDDLLDQLAALPDHPGERRGGLDHGG